MDDTECSKGPLDASEEAQHGTSTWSSVLFGDSLAGNLSNRLAQMRQGRCHGNSQPETDQLEETKDGADTASMALLNRMLSLESLVLTNKTMSFLSQEDVCRLFIRIITRPDTNEDATACNDPANEQENASVVRSYRATSVLCRAGEPVESFLSMRLSIIVEELFEIFSESSGGLLAHFAQIFQRLIRSMPGDFVDILLANERAHLTRLVLNAHHSAVTDCVLSLFHCALDMAHRQRVYDAMRKCALLPRLCRLSVSEDVDLSSAANEALERILGALENVSRSGALAVFPEDETAKEVLGYMLEIYADAKAPPQQRLNAITVVQVYYDCWQRRCAEDVGDRNTPLVTYLSERLDVMTATVVEIAAKGVMQHQIRFGCYTVHSLGLLLLRSFSVVYHVLTVGNTTEPTPQALSRIPPSFWKLLVTTYFSHTHSSIYQALFYRFFIMAVKSGDLLTLHSLLSRPKTVTRLVQQCSAPQRDRSGFSLLMLCALRLAAQTSASHEPINTILCGNGQWKKFCPELDARLANHIGGKSSILPGKSVPCRPELGPRLIGSKSQCESDCLPSDCSLSTFFSYQVGLPLPNGSEKAVKETSATPDGISNDVAQEPEVRVRSKKKNKKKKRKKQVSSNASNTPSPDGEDSMNSASQ